jgi:two-component system, NtrC family, response regulator HydG
MAGVLVVDDEPKLGRLVAEALELDGHAVVRVGGGRAALVELAQRPFDVVLTDLKMPEVDGLAVLQAAQALSPPPAVVVMTAFGTTESAVAAMKAGAADYLTKPFALDELRLRVRRLAEQRGAEAKSERLVQQLTPALVGESPRMKAVLAAARQVARSDASVLLLGESGTGKSQLARLIHYSSRRAGGSLVEVHCAALPETLLESELFGHEKGAFTGATERKVGHLAAADAGTLFLDEIGEVTPATQVKLLRFLQSREFVPVGSTAARKVDVRVISATNRDLGEAVREGRFREDFFYRLNVFAIEVPPLRERREDTLPLAESFLASRGLPPSKLSAGARDRLLAHHWPGNVRELENALERGLILAGEGEVLAEHLGAAGPALARSASRAADVLVEGFNLDAFERDLLHAALERAGGNKTAAARLLGITRRRLYSRLQSLDERLADDEAGD